MYPTKWQTTHWQNNAQPTVLKYLKLKPWSCIPQPENAISVNNTQVLKPTLHQNCPCSAFYLELWVASEKSHMISVQHIPDIKIIRKATIHEIISSWHQVSPVHMVRPDDMQQVTTQGNHPHTFTTGSTPKLGQSLRQCQHQKHGNCFSLGNTSFSNFAM